jgi:hypothetical protein
VPDEAVKGARDRVLRAAFRGVAILAGVWSRWGGLLSVSREVQKIVRVKV